MQGFIFVYTVPMQKKIDSAAIKALALDLDGTTLMPDTNIGERTIRCLKKLKSRGIQLIFCTGRAIESSQSYYNAIGADGPMVFFNGAEIAEVPEVKVISSTLLDLEVVDFSIDLARNMDIHFHMFLPLTDGGWEALYIDKRRPESDTYYKHTGIEPVVADLKTLITAPELHGVLKAMFIADPVRLKPVRQTMHDRFGSRIYTTCSSPTFLEILNSSVSKGNGLKTVMELRHLKPEEVIAFGDEENDLPMFGIAGFSAAPSSAKETIRQAADFIYGPTAEEGIAVFLEEIFSL